MIDVSSLYKIAQNEKVFIDTNILIYLFSPNFVSSGSTQIDKYSKILELLLAKDAQIYISSVVVSEFINRILRIDYETHKSTYPDFKYDYRPSNEYKTTLRLILRELKKILKISYTINDDFDGFDILDWYSKDVNNDLDFNDLHIAYIVDKNNLKLLTNDSDFKNFGVNTNWYL
jgi:predicted nucleic acid-binding protein